MKICHVCGYSCEDGIEICPVCGADVSADGAEENTKSEQNDNSVFDIVIENPSLAITLENPVTAEIFCDTLKDNGILFTCDQPDFSMGMHMGFGNITPDINIYVDESDLDKAKSIFEDLCIEDSYIDEEFDGEN